MTVDYNDGKFHGWNGGECPVHPKTVVEFWTCKGYRAARNSGDLIWDHINKDYIIAFRVSKVHREPKTIWVNESEGIIYGAYLSEEAARRTTYPNTTRVAVKYQEVIENE